MGTESGGRRRGGVEEYLINLKIKGPLLLQLLLQGSVCSSNVNAKTWT